MLASAFLLSGEPGGSGAWHIFFGKT